MSHGTNVLRLFIWLVVSIYIYIVLLLAIASEFNNRKLSFVVEARFGYTCYICSWQHNIYEFNL